MEYVAHRSDVSFDLVDISVRWRESYDEAVWKRAIGGNIQLIRDCIRLVRCLRRKPHVVHLTTPGGLATFRDNIMSRIAARAGVPVVYHLHFGRVPQVITGNSLEARNLKSTIQRVFSVMPIDMETEAALREWSSTARITRVPNCVDFDCLPNRIQADEVRPSVMFLGNVLATKGICELLQAWIELNPPGWRLKIVGECDPEYQKELVVRYPSETVEFLGNKPHEEAMQLLARSSVFILPSYTEGFPNAVLEAMALGKPIIGTRVGAIPEMLEADCGVLISPKDSHAVREAMELLMNDGDLRKRLAMKARVRAFEEYSLESVFNRYKEAWLEAAAGHAKKNPAEFEMKSTC